MSIVLTGGGTGGHLAIVASVKEHLKEELIYVGSISGQDRDWFEDDSSFSAKYFLDTQSVVDKGKIGKVLMLSKIFKEAFKIKKILKKHNAKVVFSVGGFSAAPAAFASIMARIPLVIHEQNAYIGNLNKLLKPFAKEVISPYNNGTIQIDAPIKQFFFDTYRVRDELKTILISGGSQGSVSLNNLALKLAPYFAEKGIKIYHQAGVKNEHFVREEYKKLGINAEVFGFTKELPQIINRADFAIARAGSSTLWELTANGLPALFIPYPYAANDHQYYNAKYLVDKGLGFLLRDSEIEENRVIDIIKKADLKKISQGLKAQISPNGAKKIAEILESF